MQCSDMSAGARSVPADEKLGFRLDSAVAPDDEALSLFYTVLPRILQKRVPKLPSLRHTASTYASPRSHSRAVSDVSTASFGSQTPPPSYRTRPSTPSQLTDVQDDDDTVEIFSSAPCSRPSTSGSATPAPLTFGYTSEDGIESRSAQHGLTLLQLAARESTSQTATDNLSRRLYIDGVGYLIRGLPASLSAEEEVVLRAAIPEQLSSPTPADFQLVRQPHSHFQQQPGDMFAATPQQSVVHRFVATSTLYTLLALSFVLPYVQLLAQQVWAFDRKHRVSERGFAQVALIAQLLGAQMLGLMAMVWDMNDGQVRDACRDMGVWVLKDVSGGAHEGVGKAIEVMRMGEKRR